MLRNESADYIVSAGNSSNLEFDANGHTVSFGDEGIGAIAGSTLTLKDSKGTGTYKASCIDPFDSTIIIESGNFDIEEFGFGLEMAYGNLIINGGKFSIDPSDYVSK